MANLGILPYLTVSVLLLSFTQTSTSFGLTDLLVAPACTAIVGAISTGTCAQEFDASIQPFKSADGSVPGPVGCCAVTTLRYCILDQIEKTCGAAASSTVDLVLKGITGAVKSSSGELPCDGNEFYYRKESPLCWPVWGHAVGAVLLFLLLVVVITTCCCVCCKKCCCKSSKKRDIVLNMLPTHNTPPPYSRLTE